MTKNITSFSDFVNESRKISKKNTNDFIKKVKSILDEHDFKLNTENFEDKTRYNWKRDYDKYGEVIVTMYDDSSYVYTIFIRFNDVQTKEDAKKLATNKYSGKTNIHDGDMESAIETLNDLLDKMKE